MMNKIILLLLASCSLVFAGEEDGTGTTTSNTTNETVYQLICEPVVNQNETSNCVIIEVEAEN